MITLRMLALAAALLLGTPLVIAALPNDGELDVDGGELVNKNLEAAAWIVDVALLDAPPAVDGRNDTFREEQLVEGHTVFVVVDIEIQLNLTNSSVNVTGFVECSHEVSWQGPMVGTPVGNVPFPGRIDRAGAECRAGERVFATPDPFFDPDTSSMAMTPTGVVLPITTPSGEPGFVEEYSFTLVQHDSWGDTTERTLYAYAAPIYAPWMHTDGRPKSFVVSLPYARLEEMGEYDFTFILEDDPRLKLA